MPRNGLTHVLGCCNSSLIRHLQSEQLCCITPHKPQAYEHLPGDEPIYTHRDREWGTAPSPAPEKENRRYGERPGSYPGFQH